MAILESIPQPTHRSEALDRFLVCGLGSLGQHCVVVLKEFGVKVSAIDVVQPQNWEISGLLDLLEAFLTGDCRRPDILEQAQIRQCRAILLVTSDERVNIEAAFAARLLNPQIYLIVRSAKQNLNELLGRHLGKFVAYEPIQLSATAFALAALSNQALGFFKLEEQLLQVVRYQIQPHDFWCDRWLVHGLNNRNRRVLSHTPRAHLPQPRFYQWEPDTRIRAGDTLVCVEVAEQPASPAGATTRSSRQWRRWSRLVQDLKRGSLRPQIVQFWQVSTQHQIRRVAIICGITILFLLLSGTLLFSAQYPDIGWRNAFFATANLLLGGYGDLFGQLKLSTPTPWWLQLFSFSLTLAGTAFVGILYALLTENLLTSRFQFLAQRPPVPEQDHVVLIGLGRVGQRVAALLQDLRQPMVGITTTSLAQGILPQMPLIVGSLPAALAKANLPAAKSVVVVTEDEVTNLEIGLMAHGANPTGNLVIRAVDSSFSSNLARLFPHAQALLPYALAAEAFAAAAFGENVLSLFRLYNQTVLVTEYRIEASDTLKGLILAEVSYGYGVVPILHQARKAPSKLMPSEDVQLHPGDRLVVLATSNGLQCIERGEMAPRRWQVQIEKAAGQDAIFEGGGIVARVSGCSLSLARNLMHHLPGTLPLPLYKHQAQRLVQELAKVQVLAHQVPLVHDPGDKPSNTSSL